MSAAVSSSPADVNAAVWRRIYAEGKGDLRYPSDVLVRVAARLLDPARDRRILDFGFGTGANLLHFAMRGFEAHGLEISEHALGVASQRFAAAGMSADLRLIEPGAALPYPEGYFDVTYAWQVLYYANLATWFATIERIDRAIRPGGRVLLAIAAPGDVSRRHAVPLGDSTYRSTVPGQEGCILIIPDRDDLPRLLPDRELEIGEFGFSWGCARSHHWIITYCTRAP
jgi:SAM-dependent methyltransferase